MKLYQVFGLAFFGIIFFSVEEKKPSSYTASFVLNDSSKIVTINAKYIRLEKTASCGFVPQNEINIFESINFSTMGKIKRRIYRIDYGYGCSRKTYYSPGAVYKIEINQTAGVYMNIKTTPAKL